MTSSLTRKRLTLTVSLLILLLPLVFVALFVMQKHQWAIDKIAEIEPRYARLMGLDAGRQDLTRAKATATEFLAHYAYPSSMDASQTVNDAQQRVRSLFASSDLEVSSSQVLPLKTEKDFDLISISLRADGELASIQSAMVVLASESPAILVDGFTLQPTGAIKVDAPIRLTAQFTLSVLRVRQ